MPDHPIIAVNTLGMPWTGLDPFIFTVHHVDHYPAGNDLLGPARPLAGRTIGSDFSYQDGWSMYHGDVVPGFPRHPHRGFETVTVVRRGYVDHSDSLGATGRYGQGDVQWLTTGSGVMHSEMFPLLDPDAPNPLELFQIWLNLPPESKMVPAHYGMLWNEDIPTVTRHGASIDLVAGVLDGDSGPAAPPDSWASQSGSEVAIWVIDLEPEAEWELPAGPDGVNRALYFHEGTTVQIAGTEVHRGSGLTLRAGIAAPIVNTGAAAGLLLLQGRPIGAPVFQMGPFVMNTPQQLRDAVDDYHRTGFGGWPWPSASHVHGRDEGRFAIHVDGRLERRGATAPV